MAPVAGGRVRGGILGASLACALFAGVAAVSGVEVDQQQLEAAYLYKFGGYVTWPDKAFAKADSPIVIGVVDADRLADDLTNLVAGRTIAGRPVAVKRVHAEDSLAGVHILFLGGVGSAQAAGLFESARGRPILVVTEGGDGLARGAAVSFVVVDERVRFDVSLDAVQDSGLKLSALLLSVAHEVRGARQ
jgi:hypothetical protein